MENVNAEEDKEFFKRALKGLSTKEIENIFSKALGEAVGGDYEASISDIDFEPTQNAFMEDATKITITIKNKEEPSSF